MMDWLLGNYSITALTGKIRNISLEKQNNQVLPKLLVWICQGAGGPVCDTKMLQYGLSPEQQLTVQKEKIAVTIAT